MRIKSWYVGGVVLAACLAFAPAQAAYVSYTNGILEIEIENAGSSAGMWWARTGVSHPVPDANILYHTETSYTTLRDETASEIWTNAGGIPSTNLGGFVSRSMQLAPATAIVTSLPTGFRTTYTLPNWTVVEDVVINGTTLADSNIRQSVTVTNTSGVSRQYGVRFMWDWEIAGNDSSVFRTRNPDGTFTDVFIGYANPAFQAFEMQDSLIGPTFSVFGTVGGGSLTPPPTTPDRFGYVSWSNFYSAPWDLAITGSQADSATVHYWGYTAPLTLAPSASATFIEYISTQQSSVGLGAPAPVPTLSQWTLIALALLLAVAGAFAARNRRGTSV